MERFIKGSLVACLSPSPPRHPRPDSGLDEAGCPQKRPLQDSRPLSAQDTDREENQGCRTTGRPPRDVRRTSAGAHHISFLYLSCERAVSLLLEKEVSSPPRAAESSYRVLSPARRMSQRPHSRLHRLVCPTSARRNFTQTERVCSQFRAKSRRDGTQLAGEGDPMRGLDLNGRAVAALADDLHSPERRRKLDVGLAELRSHSEGLPQ